MSNKKPANAFANTAENTQQSNLTTHIENRRENNNEGKGNEDEPVVPNLDFVKFILHMNDNKKA